VLFFCPSHYLERERYNMTFKPLHDRVVVRRVENDEKLHLKFQLSLLSQLYI